MRSILPSSLGTEQGIHDEINEQEIDVKITDVGDFLGNLKMEKYNYIDMSEVNKRHSKTKSKLSTSRSNVNYSKNFSTASRLTGMGGSNTKLSMLLNKKRGLGNLGSKRMDIREKIKNLKLNKGK